MITPPTITPLLVAELLVEGERWPVCVHVIDASRSDSIGVDEGLTIGGVGKVLHAVVANALS